MQPLPSQRVHEVLPKPRHVVLDHLAESPLEHLKCPPRALSLLLIQSIVSFRITSYCPFLLFLLSKHRFRYRQPEPLFHQMPLLLFPPFFTEREAALNLYSEALCQIPYDKSSEECRSRWGMPYWISLRDGPFEMEFMARSERGRRECRDS